jgi:hypothetical protein
MQRHKIEIDGEVLADLGQKARPFIDKEPNDVLRRVLALDDEVPEPATEQERESVVALASARTPRKKNRSRQSGAKRTRVRKGSLLDEREYELPILQTLAEHGGRAAAREVIERVGQLVDDRLTPMDRENVETGGIRWQARVQFARLRLKDKGDVKDDSPRGVWEISEQGRDRLGRENATAA